MHKKLEADLISLAHSILQMKNKDNVFLLKQKSKDIYEKLSILAFVEEYVNSTPNIKETKEDLIDKVEKAIELKESAKEEVEKVIHQLEETKVIKEEEVIEVDEILEQPFEELEEIMFSEPETKTEEEPEIINDVVKVEESKTMSLEEELKDTISVDEIATLFDIPVPKSLNDKLNTNIQIGLNDRIAFVKNLFEGSQEDFNRVISQVNTYATVKEAKKFINKMVKPDYDWSNQEELEARLIDIIERKFA
ncbi:hypothetical protein [Polaribacter sp. Z022]|uniref:hypothetical protein n=1 Tax=Polaribacter sp. Z022 TaxID=2927125 RepID=UPI0020213D8A|nr:hypothetical protein [Polaribacter sp. Z022]MCL7752841.1 hypothetical protein [Polaribacter sp. Z022]